MTTLTFADWVAHWGETRLAEIIDGSQTSGRRRWESRERRLEIWSFPALELRLGNYWQESLDEWHSRWERCGRRLAEGRMIASKWDPIWTRLSSTFPDGFGHPFPPYARSSCAYWADIDQDEAIVVGAISEAEFKEHMARFPREPLKDKDGQPIPVELLQAARQELELMIHQRGGPPPGASRAERVANKNQRREESFARARAEYEQRHSERAEQNAVFRLLEQVEAALREGLTEDSIRWEWLRASVNTLTTTAHFDRYPNWRARAWVSCAELHRIASDSASELSCLEHALSINDKLPIKRRIKTLQRQT